MARLASALITLLAGSCWTTPLSAQATASSCPVPNWTVQGVSVTYSDDTYTPGLASFNITNSVTRQPESLTCELSFNTLCQINGTPRDANLYIYFQVNIQTAVIQFNQSWTCETTVLDPARPSFVIASSELELTCPEEVTETMTCTGLFDSFILVSGSIVTSSPDPPANGGQDGVELDGSGNLSSFVV